jgi:hypothetical protein
MPQHDATISSLRAASSEREAIEVICAALKEADRDHWFIYRVLVAMGATAMEAHAEGRNEATVPPSATAIAPADVEDLIGPAAAVVVHSNATLSDRGQQATEEASAEVAEADTAATYSAQLHMLGASAVPAAVDVTFIAEKAANAAFAAIGEAITAVTGAPTFGDIAFDEAPQVQRVFEVFVLAMALNNSEVRRAATGGK